jgi:hypothetical protein
LVLASRHIPAAKPSIRTAPGKIPLMV